MKTTSGKTALLWLWLSVFIITIDQLTKYLVFHYLTFGSTVKNFSWLNLTLNYNTGAAFSFLSTESGWQVYFFSLISLIVVIFLIVWLSRTQRSDKWRAIGFSLIVGGALGNFIDRVRLGCVIDFVDFHIKNWHYATFNIADSAICMGVFLLIVLC
ncbi:signal peptidase II [Coxiella endosymbiont of Dermacentor marginatus]|uniref:signal peptidase II n=1 Tax=Coxiella endosymbiont of Dermacentor marginatus TaxID=1656159 RepID=UPI00222380AF|nr:signal peptidase II [Coxiella endosymbiont of Dermacentor marginatus]